MPIKASELILNPDGSVYHLNLKPENISSTIIFVGDQDRVNKISKHFDSIEFETQKREFKTHTGTFKGKRISVISTGIGVDNIDIVLNELDALVNIDLSTRQPKPNLTTLNIVRIGTSGSVQNNIPVNSFVISSHALDLTGMLHYYEVDSISNPTLENAFINQTNWHNKKAAPIIINNDNNLEKQLESHNTYKGITATTIGFYGPQGRVLRLPLHDSNLNNKITAFNHKGSKVSNFEMETSAIYGLSKLLGHKAVSINAIIANRANGTFSENPEKVVEDLITYVLEKI